MNAIRLASAVANPDLQVIGGGHPEPEIRRGPGLQKHFLALRASVWSKNKRETRATRAPPLDPPLYHIDFGLSQ